MANIQAVLFDYGMVLSGPPDQAAKERMEMLLNATSERFHDAYWRFRDAYDRGVLNAAEYWLAVASALQRKVAPNTLEALIEADTEHWGQPNEPMIAWALVLQQTGVKTGILSNIGDAMEESILSRFSWMNGFSHRTFSHRLKIAKPDIAIYHYAAQGLKTQPAEILFIDDREENVLAARTAGMVALRYDNHEAFVAGLQGLGQTDLPPLKNNI
ncbi:HAD-IA family hydrolase [Granulicella sp. 5B5]|uniref:HAD family hydrolase n=1 Tax=Granulicella sp. 5B5 TaxID=1617967 RepID=UPI0015F6CC18|nr:HAD family phosphatase [Granulicella sp. 5B5]QMV17486.1 HAD-IA family hydrolase [Granulicella sp. 5B5]